MRLSHFLYISCILLLLCCSIQVVTAAEEYAYVGQWGGQGPPIDPCDVAVDSTGNVFVTDNENNRIQKFTSNGTYITQWGSPGSGDGQFNSPEEIALDSLSNIYITDIGNQRVQKFASNGTYITQWSIGNGQNIYEAEIAVDSVGNVYVVDSPPDYYFRIQKFTSNGTLIATWASQYLDPQGPYWKGNHAIAVDSLDNVYITDSYTSSSAHDVSHNARVLTFTSSGVLLAQWGSHGWSDGQFTNPVGITLDHADNVYVSDGYRIQKFTSSGTFITKWGDWGREDGQFTWAYGLAVDSAGNVFVADNGNQRVQKFTSTGIYLTQWGRTNDFSNGKCWRPTGIAVDGGGNVYETEESMGRVQKFTSNGDFVTNWGEYGTGEGQFNQLRGVAVDSTGNVYVADTGNDRIQKFTPNGIFTSEWGTGGSGDGHLYSPCGIMVDTADNVYVAESGAPFPDPPNFRVQMFTSTGTFLKKWGASGTVDGGRFWYPLGITVDSAGNVYVADTGNNRIQKFTSTGEFITAWGSGGSGNGQFDEPWGVAVDRTGRVIVADTGNNRTQVFDSDGTFITTWGSAGLGEGQFNEPRGVAVDSAGIVYVADTGNNRVQKFAPTGISVDSITPDTADLTTKDVGVSVRGGIFPPGTTFELVNATLGTITCLPNTVARVSDTELKGNLSLTDVKPGLYDVVVTTPDGTTGSLEKGFDLSPPVPVVLVHGWRSGPGMWDAFESALKEEGIPYWNFGYDGTADPTLSAYELVGFIREKRSTYRPDLYPNGYTGKIDIVCHSMGAIVSRWSMEALGHGNEVRQWIGIAPAHGGSAGADLMDITIVDGPIHWLISWALGPAATEQLKTTSNSVQYLKTDALSDSTTYRVIAGWNPYHSYSFGNLFLSVTQAKAPDGTLYGTFNGDMIVAQAQSYREGMGFECFPIQNDPDGGNDEPRSNFDHTSIHHSKAVIKRVIKYLKNPETPNEVRRPADYLSPDPLMRYDLVKLVKGTIVSSSQENVETFSFGAGTAATDVLVADLEWTEGSLSLELTDPNGQTFTTATSTSTAWSLSDSNHRLFTIASPATGSWSAKIIPLSVPDHPIGYNLTVYRPCLNETPTQGTPTPTPTPTVTSTPTQDPRAPVANFTWTPVNVTAGVPVTFWDNSTGNPTAWRWMQDGDELSTVQNLSVTFTIPCTRSISLVAMNSYGWSAPKTVVINVVNQTVTPTTTPATIPTAAFTAAPVWGPAPLSVQFTDTSMNSPTSWLWTFGDGFASIDRHPNHTYTTAGMYAVNLRVTNDGGSDSELKVGYINVTAPLPAVRPITGGAGSPDDTNGDGRYDDVNGNGRPDFADVVLYFNQMTWISGNEPVSAFDYNGNGRIDFADVVWLFNHL